MSTVSAWLATPQALAGALWFVGAVVAAGVVTTWVDMAIKWRTRRAANVVNRWAPR